ncbi:MAG: hypothetical protein ACR2M1_03340 [Gemmatimonadaceae bacterium]
MPKPPDQNRQSHDAPHQREHGSDSPSQSAREALTRQIPLLESICSDDSAPRTERLRAMELLAAIAGLRVSAGAREQLAGPDTRPAYGPRDHGPRDHRPKHDRPGEHRHDKKKGPRNHGPSKALKAGDGAREPRRLDTGAKTKLPSGRPVRRLPSGD